MALADALAMACAEKPCMIVDFATLTGACMVALGEAASGLFGTDDDLVERGLGLARYRTDAVDCHEVK